MSLFLGLDSSTQSLSAMVIDTDTGKVVLDLAVNFGRDLPQYESPNGFLAHADPLVKHSNPLMWLDALELVLSRGRAQGFDWGRVAGLSGSGQQHGSVYLNSAFAKLAWDPARSLADLVRPCLSRASAPIWMDSSTNAECQEIAAAAGGVAEVVKISGSRPIERFTGPQIRKFSKAEPAAYAATARIHLVSSFMAAVLCGGDVPVDFGDGAGMNLLHLANGAWSNTLMRATAPDLANKLPVVVPSGTLAGEVSSYFVRKYGFRAGTPVVVWTGDNPSSLIGMGAGEPGTAVISLGTSDTYFAAMRQPTTDPRGYGHVFGNPAGGFMSLIAFKNGSLAREQVKDRFGYTWEQFTDAILRQTQPGNGGALMLPYFVPEITPLILQPAAKLYGSAAFTAWQQGPAAVRAICEAQAISMQRHADYILDRPTQIRVTGGASRNAGVLQVLADVFNARLARLSGVTNSAALGAALRAANTVGKHDWATLYAAFAVTDADSVVTPNASAAAAYGDLRLAFAAKLKEAFGV